MKIPESWRPGLGSPRGVCPSPPGGRAGRGGRGTEAGRGAATLRPPRRTWEPWLGISTAVFLKPKTKPKQKPFSEITFKKYIFEIMIDEFVCLFFPREKEEEPNELASRGKDISNVSWICGVLGVCCCEGFERSGPAHTWVSREGSGNRIAKPSVKLHHTEFRPLLKSHSCEMVPLLNPIPPYTSGVSTSLRRSHCRTFPGHAGRGVSGDTGARVPRTSEQLGFCDLLPGRSGDTKTTGTLEKYCRNHETLSNLPKVLPPQVEKAEPGVAGAGGGHTLEVNRLRSKSTFCRRLCGLAAS